jgi:hypothetical protein
MPLSQEVTLGTGSQALHGTLQAPAERGASEPVLILAGSGPTDRNGDSPLGITAQPYRLLAEALARQGIPSLRVDKRGIAASAAAATAETDLRVQTYAQDARAWMLELKRRTGARCVWLLGHSEGTLHALLAAQDNGDVCGLILVSPVGRRFGDILRDQLRSNPANAPILAQALHIITELEAGRSVSAEGMHPALMPLFRPSVQPFMISVLALDPPALVRSYRGPVMVIQGTTDLQTGLADAQALADARRGVRLEVIQGMNHVLKIAPADRASNIATYAQPDLSLAPGLAETIARFIRRR